MKYVFSLLTVVMICGCSTFDSIPNKYNYPGYNTKVYAGTRNDFDGITYFFKGEPAWGMIALTELPFCLAADTILLPYTIFLDCCKKEPDPLKKD